MKTVAFLCFCFLYGTKEKVTQPDDLKDFMKGRYSSYKSLQTYCLINIFSSAPPIQQTPAMRKYLSFYRNLLEKEDPLYFAVGLLPCARLWVWLGNNLSTPPTNAYYTWKVENMRKFSPLGS
ncbi:hypothetical protein ABG768_020952 [Culter alburnus]|uniref:Uncharacterized protein n=1 Tax=Culter alburnus TaxID=194366 RepID=A0AAW2ASW0_CULAL